LALAIVAAAALSVAQQRPEKGPEGNGSKKAEACRAEARRASYAITRGSGSSSIVDAQARQELMRAHFMKCMGRS
jgi:hypothetical protein